MAAALARDMTLPSSGAPVKMKISANNNVSMAIWTPPTTRKIKNCVVVFMRGAARRGAGLIIEINTDTNASYEFSSV